MGTERRVKIVAVIDAENGQFNNGMADVEERTKRTASVMEGIWQGVGQAVTRALVDTAAWGAQKLGEATSAIKNEIMAGVKSAGEFEKATAYMSVKGLQDTARFQQELKALSNELGENLPEMAQAAIEALSRGVPEDNLIDVVKESLQVAGASGEELTTVINGIVDVLNAYRLGMDSAGEIGDQFISAQRAGKLAVGELAIAMGQLAPMAATVGIEHTELIAIMTEATTRGMKMREVVGGLRSIMENLISPTGTATEAIGRMGLDAKTAAEMIREGGLVEFLRDIGPENMDKLAQNASELSLMLAIMGQDAGLAFQKTFSMIQESAGASNEAFEMVENTTLERWTDLLTRYQNMMQEIGTPINEYLGQLLDVINDQLTSRFPEIGERMREAIGRLLAGGISSEEQAAINLAVEEGRMTTEEAMARIYAQGPGEKLSEQIGNWASQVADRIITDIDGYLNGNEEFTIMLGRWLESTVEELTPVLTRIGIKMAGIVTDSVLTALIRMDISKRVMSVLEPLYSAGDWIGTKASDFIDMYNQAGDAYDQRYEGERGMAGYAGGGIVPGYGGGDIVPARLEPGEMVIPKELTAAIMGGMGGRNTTIQINGYDKDPRDLAREIREILKEGEMLGIGLTRIGPEFAV